MSFQTRGGAGQTGCNNRGVHREVIFPRYFSLFPDYCDANRLQAERADIAAEMQVDCFEPLMKNSLRSNGLRTLLCNSWGTSTLYFRMGFGISRNRALVEMTVNL